jgi:hypothetical protein
MIVSMFEELIEATMGLTDGELDAELRASELALRGHAARHATLIAVIENRGVYRADDHRTMTAYLRATCNTSGTQITNDRKLARLLNDHPTVGDALLDGRISVGHALEVSRVQANPRIAWLLPHMLSVFLDDAEHSSHRDFHDEIDEFIQLVDQDGAFADLASAVEGRTAHVNDVAGTLAVTVVGGDPVTSAQFIAVFESFVEGEYRADVAARHEMYGVEADQHPLPRTTAQRRYDAMISMASAAAASPEGRALPEPTTHIVIDERSTHEALTHAGITLPSGDLVELDDDGNPDAEAVLTSLADELVVDPEAFRRRRCETSTGTKIHPTVALRALLTGHVRRVVVNSQGVVVDYGTKQRLFSGLARQAALLLASTCTHPGCRLPARLCQVDHITEWSTGNGATDQRNGAIKCGGHNRFKHRQRWKTRRDQHGRIYNIRADGTIVLPVGERPPDLSADELAERTRARLTDLTLA